jgi:lysophospholipase L1-like esterase
MLTGRFPGGCFEVVNLALGGYDSYQDYERMRVEGSALAPDVVIVHSGINDVRNSRFRTLSDTPPDPRTLLWQSQLRDVRGPDGSYAPNFWARVKHYSYLARLPGFMRMTVGTRKNLGTIQEARAYPAAVDYFTLNVKRTIDLSLSLRAAVILSTPPSAIPIRNRPTDPVEKSYWIKDAATTEAYRRTLSERMDSLAREYAAAGRPVRHVSHRLEPTDFLDDAHLLSSGNRAVAQGLLEAVTPFVREALRSGRSCAGR